MIVSVHALVNETGTDSGSETAALQRREIAPPRPHALRNHLYL
jgi:hypothetical protein